MACRACAAAGMALVWACAGVGCEVHCEELHGAASAVFMWGSPGGHRAEPPALRRQVRAGSGSVVLGGLRVPWVSLRTALQAMHNFGHAR